MRAISRSKSTAASGCVLKLVGMVFFLVGSGLFIGLSGVPLLNWFNAQSWPSVTCTILSSSVGTHSSSDGGDTYSVDIRYAYEYDGVPYESDRYNFFGGSSSGYDGKQAAVEQYPAGELRQCYINPETPSEAVLNRDFSLTYLIGGFGLIFVFVSLFILFAGTRAVDRAAHPVPSMFRGEGAPKTYSYTISSGTSAIPIEAPDLGTIALKGGYNSIGGFVGLLIFALIWNGIISFAVWDTVDIGDGGAFDVVSALFLIPFVLIGIGLIFGVGYFFLTLFNPRPDLKMTPGYLPLGGAVVVSWSFRGNPSRIQKLTIFVQGQEAATYRRGTSTSTDRSVFEKIVAIETVEPAAIAAGEATFTMPEFTAPSFNGPNNKIQWQVKVHGEIHRWPDVNEEFELVVHPLPLPEGSTHQPAEFHLSGSGESA
ncbi:MAG: DUF3592 domain-containing protein [Candidatus Hydrogenedentes bacterium]|nr:DUF3592 domain-containing protein [Candidatus Hydrogenedentota bacterium]